MLRRLSLLLQRKIASANMERATDILRVSLYLNLFGSLIVPQAHSSDIGNDIVDVSKHSACNGSHKKSFPDDFLFGVSTAAYQVEGGWNADGKGESIWDHLVHTSPDIVANKDNGDVASDSYHRFKEDVALIKDLGFQVYRFSISWPRILPNGEITNINKAGVQYYHALIDELLKNDIQPMVTMYHWDLPQRLQDMGGWSNPLMALFMEDYADLLFQLYGGKVKYWITINEPQSIVRDYSSMEKIVGAPALRLDSPTNYIVTYNLLRAHARIYKLYNDKYRAAQNGKVTMTIDTGFYKEKSSSKEDIEATKRAWAFNFELYANPIFGDGGDFPELVKTIVAKNSKEEGRKRSRLPEFTDEEIKSLKGSFDFFSLNHYSSSITSQGDGSYSNLIEKDRNVKFEEDPKWEKFGYGSVVPWGLRETLRYIKEKYNNPPVFITENGYCNKSRELDDPRRIHYFRSYLKEVVKAKENFGCNVIGYTAWSIMDNFEWNSGYTLRFGLFDVDFTDPKRKRTPRSSAKFFKELLKTRVIPK